MKRDDVDIPDDELEASLRAHLGQHLDPQRGKALAAFERDGDARSTPSRLRLTLALLAPASIAAALLIGWMLLRPAPRDIRVPEIAGQPDPADAAFDLEPGEVERLVTWRAIDEGPRVIDASPVRRVRLKAIEQIRWADPEMDATIRLSVPQEQVILVRQQTF